MAHTSKNVQSIPASRVTISRSEFSRISGIAVPTLHAMAREHRGPVCIRPEGFSYDLYQLQDVNDWLLGKEIPTWNDAPCRKSKRGENLRKKRSPGRQRKRPKLTITSKKGGE
ncbi:hypothetical protein [Varunaivibrio sulfuroxidans]|uniref:hypothetical protein n=1 Tax=Varunaivibrio sulfuroxidans TaxID=1773489 RepID=UPI0010442BF7|nr:hypothetical protein [Varunaivibrio sulfuroxidans]WES29531.1 hypothetical protein P3M64_07620 [Varunaivibrio sulfuroxidans]